MSDWKEDVSSIGTGLKDGAVGLLNLLLKGASGIGGWMTDCFNAIKEKGFLQAFKDGFSGFGSSPTRTADNRSPHPSLSPDGYIQSNEPQYRAAMTGEVPSQYSPNARPRGPRRR